MAEWSDNQNRMLSTLETLNNHNPTTYYYICGCFQKKKKNGSFNTENTLTDDLLNVTENPLKESSIDSQDSTVIVSSTHSSIKTDSYQERDVFSSQVAVLASKMKGNVRFSE